MSYGQDNGGDGAWERTAQLILMLSQLRGGATESQIHTQEPVSVRVRFGLPALNALGVFLSFVLALGGVFLMTWGMAWLLELDWDPRGWLLAWCLLVAAAWGVAAGVRRFLRQSVRIVQAFAAVGVALVLGLVVGSLLLTVQEKFGWQLASMVVGAGLVLGCVGWGYNQASELMRGYWRQSPFETAIINEFLPLFAQMLGMRGEAEKTDQVRVDDPRYLIRGGNGVVARPVAPQAREYWEDDEEETELVTIDPETGNLIWFARFAARLPTLSIRDLTVRPAPVLPFWEDGKELRLRRAMIRRLLVRGSTEDEHTVDGVRERGLGAGGFWELRGQGATPEWVKPRDQVLRETEGMWRHVYGDEMELPDYWADVNDLRQRAA